MSSIINYLPPGDGLLPKWLLLVSVVSMANSIQSYSSLYATQRVYSGPKPATPSTSTPEGIPPSTLRPQQSSSPVTPLSARTFGTWTAITAVLRLYAAYHIHNREMYELAIWSFGVAWAHFVSEWLIFKSTSLQKGLYGPLVVSTGSLIWMWTQWESYVKA